MNLDARILLPGLAAGTTAALGLLTVPPLLAAAVTAAATWTVLRFARSRPTPPPTATAEPRLLSALRLRDEALANTVHELRTPLTAVMTALEMIRDGFAVNDADRGIFLDQATVAGQHMAFLINDLLDIAAIDAGKLSLHVRPLHAGDVAHDIRTVMGLMTQARASELVVQAPDDDVTLQGDRSRVLQVVFNLVSNAVKYSPHDTPIVVQFRPQDTRVRIEVLDRGYGVAPELRDRLFARFGRTGAECNSEAPSTGLGLHLCQQLVAHMHGEIGYEPRQGGGSVFWFALPLAPTAAPAPQAVIPPVPAA